MNEGEKFCSVLLRVKKKLRMPDACQASKLISLNDA